MSDRPFDYLILCCEILTLGVGLFLERGGLFLYTGYTVVEVAGTIIALRFLLWGIRFLRSRRSALFYSVALISLSLMLGAWSLSFLDSSPRKHFYLAATRIKRGDAIDTVRKRMAHYDSWQPQNDYESFGFYEPPGTSDVLIVHYDVKTGKVVDLKLSLD
jgi:hypothetical protein